VDNKPEDDASTVARLMPTLSNKLATVSLGAYEQSSVEGCEPSAVSLIRALSMQAITRSAAKRVVTHDNLVLYESRRTDPPSDESRKDIGTTPSPDSAGVLHNDGPEDSSKGLCPPEANNKTSQGPRALVELMKSA
jgi:hypothetical protein